MSNFLSNFLSSCSISTNPRTKRWEEREVESEVTAQPGGIELVEETTEMDLQPLIRV